ncbi:hypothetical protein BT96DRAFT_988535 [Gymnopus androsaceus JB14]|uniref:Uncharacterized protein n=1 Tax=Gymnopus androsaceus JB14 TaxID=1447944 RepID=A0A6A4I858_9AGAR|nr:hypothetical protein BT96DRAFT_988535 [Gymnopus androsaceus JB14]
MAHPAHQPLLMVALGWYYGNDPGSADGVAWLKDEALAQNPQALQCPDTTPTTTSVTHAKRSGIPTSTQSPSPSSTPTYSTVFSGLKGAIEASDYLTYGLVDTVADCETMCNTVVGCTFVNTYHDVNGKNGSPLLTCSLYSKSHTAAEAINTGGQTQPDGSTDFVTDSAGYTKST